MNKDLAPRFLSFRRAFARPLDKAMRAVSEAEKNAEKNSKTTKHMPPNITLGLRCYGYSLKMEVQTLRSLTGVLSLHVKQQKVTQSIFSVLN